MKSRTDDLRIERVRPLLSPAVLAEDLPISDAAAALTHDTRRAIEGVLFGVDPRLGSNTRGGFAASCRPMSRRCCS
jgi:3-deoxy-D-arabino-heptulosonate 7-phosphate (DAHP) synthase